MMFRLDNLAQTAEDLRTIGIDATYEIVYGPRGCLEGLDIAGDFFPLWELSLAENQLAVEACDFAQVKARRGPDWSPASPKYSRASV
jgi:hypothetical protein